MNARGDGSTGWSKANKICIWARLHDGDHAFTLLSGIISKNTYPNLFGFHAPFQIDCNFGYAAGVNEMLVQSHMGGIDLLPSFPKAWPTGGVKGIRVRDGYEMDLEWKVGKLAQAVVRGFSNEMTHYKIRYGKGSTTFSIKQGETKTFQSSDFSDSK